MTYTWLNLVWLFFIYSLAGWIGEVCASVICRRKFVNRGFVNGPLCPIYGFAAVLFAIFLPDLTASPFSLFLGGTLIATVLEYFTGTFMEKVFHRKLWDYSNIRFNLGGYVCLRYSLIWGALSVVLMLFVNPFLCSVLGLLPHILSVILLWVLSILLFLDFLGTALAVLGMQKQAKRFAQVTEGMQQNLYTFRKCPDQADAVPNDKILSYHFSGHADPKQKGKGQNKTQSIRRRMLFL